MLTSLPPSTLDPLHATCIGLITKEQVLAKLEATVNTKDEAELARLRLNLPEWLRFTDIHKTQWLNFLVERLWPKMSEAIGDSLRWSIIPMLEANKPAFLSELGLSHVDMGSTPLFITGARIHETRESAVMLDLGVVMDLDTNIVLRASKCGVAFNIVISHVQFQGDLRLVLCPLVPQWPCFSGSTQSRTSCVCMCVCHVPFFVVGRCLHLRV